MTEQVPNRDLVCVVRAIQSMQSSDESPRQVGCYGFIEADLSPFVKPQDDGGVVKLVDAREKIRGIVPHRRSAGIGRPYRSSPTERAIAARDGYNGMRQVVPFAEPVQKIRQALRRPDPRLHGDAGGRSPRRGPQDGHFRRVVTRYDQSPVGESVEAPMD
jgi:hypothetical protein